MIYYYPNRPILKSREFLKEKLDNKWSAEIKKNGDRLVLRKESGEWKFYNRHKKLLKYKPPVEMLDMLNDIKVKDGTQLDGELMHNHTKTIKNLVYVYDIYGLDGKQCYGTLKERRAILDSILPPQVPYPAYIRRMEYFRFTDAKDLFNGVINFEDNEGLVLKHDDGKIVWNPMRSEDVTWQIKVRKESKNYKF